MQASHVERGVRTACVNIAWRQITDDLLLQFPMPARPALAYDEHFPFLHQYVKPAAKNRLSPLFSPSTTACHSSLSGRSQVLITSKPQTLEGERVPLSQLLGGDVGWLFDDPQLLGGWLVQHRKTGMVAKSPSSILFYKKKLW